GYRDGDGSSAWPAPVASRPGKGRFFIRRTEPGWRTATPAPARDGRGGPWSGGDCACQAVGRVLGDPENFWGIELNNAERKRGVGVYLNGRGQLRLHPTYTRFAGRFPEPHGDDIAHPTIKTGDGFNTLLAVVRGRQVEVYVNGVAI